MEEKDYEIFESFLSVLGIGKESCKIVAKLSNERFYINEINDRPFCCMLQRSDFICIKGLTNIESLQNFLVDKEHIWYVMDSGRAYQDLLKEVLGAISQKGKFSLLFGDERVDKEFIYFLRGKGYIKHFVEILDKNPVKTFQVLKGLFYAYFIPSLICIDVSDIERCFSFSPIVKSEIFEIPRGYLNLDDSEKRKFFEKIKRPITVFFEFFTFEWSLDEVYEVVSYVRKMFSLNGNRLIFSVLGNEETTNKLKAVAFWTEEE